MYFHQLNDMKLLEQAISEELQLHSQINISTIWNGTYFHQLNDMKLLEQAIREELQLYGQINISTIWNGTLNAITSNAFIGMRFIF